jgi:hypothetical protein
MGIRRARPGGALAVAIVTAAVAAACSTGQAQDTASQTRVPEQRGAESDTATATSTPSPVIVAAGDIACAPGVAASSGGCRQADTARLIAAIKPTRVLALGDNQYDAGTLSAYRGSYAKSWGAFRSITRPVAGNHEYRTASASGYFDYFGTLGGTRGKGYYSYNLGTWHIVALNANCGAVGGCQAGSPQEKWLRADLAAHRTKCTLAYWHQPRWSSGRHGSYAEYAAFWNALYAYRADVVLNGHDHDYERFGRQTPAGVLDSTRGIRQFVVGTGGASHYAFPRVLKNSQVRNASQFGVLKMVLGPTSYAWRFYGTARTTIDHATTSCA